MTASLLQMVVGLAVVLAAIAGTAWLARRMGVASPHGARLMKIVAALPVGAKERVVMLEVGGQWMVLGVAPGRVSALATLPRGEVPQAAAQPQGAALAQGAGAQGIDFAALLDRVRRGASR